MILGGAKGCVADSGGACTLELAGAGVAGVACMAMPGIGGVGHL